MKFRTMITGRGEGKGWDLKGAPRGLESIGNTVFVKLGARSKGFIFINTL